MRDMRQLHTKSSSGKKALSELRTVVFTTVPLWEATSDGFYMFSLKLVSDGRLSQYVVFSDGCRLITYPSASKYRVSATLRKLLR